MDERPTRRMQALGQLVRVATFLALAGLVVDFGFPVSDEARAWIRGGQVLAVALFASNAMMRFALARDRREHVRANWLELLLLSLLFLDLLAGVFMGPSRLLRSGWFLGIQIYLVVQVFLVVAHLQERVTRREVRPAILLLASFVALALVGSGLLMLPLSRGEGAAPWTFTDAFFTATSAVCVTGLSVRDIGDDLSTRGQALLLAQIQIGGIGLVALACGAAALKRRRLRLRELSIVSEALGISSPGRLRRFLGFLLVFTLVSEIVGAVALWIATDDVSLGGENRLWWCVFHSVSAFCNAGFGLSPDSLVPWADEPWILLTLSALIVVGGLGFAVHMDLLAMRPFSAETLRWLRWRMTESVWWPWPNRMLETPVQPRLSLNSRLVLATSGILVALGTVMFFAAEATNGLDNASGTDKLVGSLFHSVAARTAGFNALDVTRLEMPTQLLLIVLMAIGASPLSTGGGMRTTTIAVAFLSVRAMVRGRDSVEAFGRSIARPVVYACISIVAMYSVALTVLTSALLATQDLPFSHLLFESVSALSTVGLSMGVTSELDDTGRWIVALGMIMGRVGPLAVLWSFVSRSRPLHYRYPEEQVVVA